MPRIRLRTWHSPVETSRNGKDVRSVLLPSVLYGFSNGLNSMYEVALHIDIIRVVVNGTVRAMYVDTWKSTSTPYGTGTRKVLYIHTLSDTFVRTWVQYSNCAYIGI